MLISMTVIMLFTTCTGMIVAHVDHELIQSTVHQAGVTRNALPRVVLGSRSSGRWSRTGAGATTPWWAVGRPSASVAGGTASLPCVSVSRFRNTARGIKINRQPKESFELNKRIDWVTAGERKFAHGKSAIVYVVVHISAWYAGALSSIPGPCPDIILVLKSGSLHWGLWIPGDSEIRLLSVPSQFETYKKHQGHTQCQHRNVGNVLKKNCDYCIYRLSQDHCDHINTSQLIKRCRVTRTWTEEKRHGFCR